MPGRTSLPVDEARRPLAGRSVWLTRPAERVRTLVASLERLGASVTARPTIAFEPPADPAQSRRAVERLAEFGWIVFTSANGVRFFRQRMREVGRTVLPVSIRIAAIGPATGRELERSGLDVDLIAEDSRSEGLAAALGPRIAAGERVLVVRPEVARPLLPDALGAIPVALSTVVSSDRRGNSLGIVVVVRDLREVEALRSQMVTQARLAAVGELSAGLAHEINNPIAFVRANLSLLRDSWKHLGSGFAEGRAERDEILRESEELIEESIEGVDRTAQIVRGINRFTHAGTGCRESADLAELLDDAAAMARPHLGQDVRLERDYAELAPVICEAGELRQVFLNLIVNAIHAVRPSAGRIRLSRRTDAGSRGRSVEIRIGDDGPRDAIRVDHRSRSSIPSSPPRTWARARGWVWASHARSSRATTARSLWIRRPRAAPPLASGCPSRAPTEITPR